MLDLSENLEARDLWALWERSVPLEQAFYRFGPPADGERYVRLKNTKPPAGILEFLKVIQKAQEKGEDIQTAMANVVRTTPEQEEAERLERTLKETCTQRLQQTVLFGIGFSSPRKPDDVPCFVPFDTWGKFIGWHTGKVANGSLKMEAVRIGETNWVEKYSHPDRKRSRDFQPDPKTAGCEAGNYQPTLPRNLTSPPGRDRPGPKSREPEILAAYSELVKERSVNAETPIKTLAHRVRQHIWSGVPEAQRNMIGLANETIRRVIRKATQDTN